MENFAKSCSSSRSSRISASSFSSSKFSSNGKGTVWDSSSTPCGLTTAEFVQFRWTGPLRNDSPFVWLEKVFIKGREFVFRRIFPLLWFGSTNGFFVPERKRIWLSSFLCLEEPTLQTLPLIAILTSPGPKLTNSSPSFRFCRGGNDVPDLVFDKAECPIFCAPKTSRKCSEGRLKWKFFVKFSLSLVNSKGGLNGGVMHFSDKLGSYLGLELLVLDEAENKRSFLLAGSILSLPPAVCFVVWACKFVNSGGDIVRRFGSKLFSELCMGASRIFTRPRRLW